MEQGDSWRLEDAKTDVMPRIVEPKPQLEAEPEDILIDALALMISLWPPTPGATVVLETHEWIRLRRVLSYVPVLVDRILREKL